MKYFIIIIIIIISSYSFNYAEKNEVYFIENKGQIHDGKYNPRTDVLFMGITPEQQCIITSKGASYQLQQVHNNKIKQPNAPSPQLLKEDDAVGRIDFHRIDMEWVSCDTNPIIQKETIMPGYNNYYNLPYVEKGIIKVRQYEDIRLMGIYKGIDVRYYGQGSNIEYDYEIAPYIDYRQIKIRISGAEIKLNNDGQLELHTPMGTIVESAPKSYQSGRLLESHWKSLGNDTWGFEVKGYDPALKLTIDPITRVWGTYYGGSSNDWANACETDASGNVYMSGSTWSTNNIATIGSHQSSIGGNSDALLVKFNSNGIQEWCTYYGGTNEEDAFGCSADASGNLIISGHTFSTSNIATSGSHQSIHGGGSYDAFLVKFNANGVRQWGTYYGDVGYDLSRKCATDVSGNIYLSGFTSSITNISTSGSHQSIYGGGSYDAFLVKFNANGVRQWATYYGGTNSSATGNYDWANGCTTDGNGNVYLAGGTVSLTNIATTGSHQSTHGGGGSDYYDCFLVKFNTNGVRQWGTYYGGSGDDVATFPSVSDLNGYVYLTGSTNSTNNMATSGSHQSNFGGGLGDDAFLVQFNSNGVRQWGTYYGDTATDYSWIASTDGTGNIYLTGSTYSLNNISTSGSYQANYAGNRDVFLVKFNINGIRQWGSYYGGTGDDFTQYSSIDANGNIYLSGGTFSLANISSTGSHQEVQGGGQDAFLVKFNGCSNSYTITTTSTNPGCGANNGTATAYPSGGTTPYTYNWSNGGNTSTITGLSAGTYNVTVYDANGCTATSSVTLNSSSAPSVIAYGTDPTGCGTSNGTATAYPSGGTTPYTYNWSNGGNTSTITGLSAGTYSVTVYDANGCTATSSVTLNSSSAPSVTASGTDPSGCGTSNGTATAYPSGGTLPYTYNWSNGGNTSTITGLAGGTYNVTVYDANVCYATASVTLTTQNAPTLVVSSSDPSACGAMDGTASVSASGGTPPYTYYWSNGQTTSTITGLLGGTYTITVYDALMCSVTSSVTLSGSTSTPTIMLSSTDPTSCGSSDGSITAYITGGTAPYTYLWDDPSSQTTATINNLAAGVYNLTVTDINGCFAYESISLNNFGGPSISIIPVNVSCHGYTDGSATIYTTNGTPPYTYLWNDPASQSTSSIINLQAGTYSVSCTDAAGCITTELVSITEPNQLTIAMSYQNITNIIICDGTATATPNGGTPPYSYQWDPNTSNQTSQTATGLCLGIYYVVVTDANNCTENNTIFVDTEPMTDVDEINPDNTLKIYPNPTNGKITISEINGIVSLFNIQGQMLLQTNDNTLDLSIYSNGIYFIQVIDEYGQSYTGKIIKK